jgi:hypothetical protein
MCVPPYIWKASGYKGEIMVPTGLPTYFDGNKPVLADSLVIYLDALGTQQRAQKLDNEALTADLETIRKFRHILDRQDLKVRSQQFAAFTDNLVLAAPVDGFSVARQLRFMITSVAHYQLGTTLSSRYPLRGGISRGLFFANDELVTGPALIKSVLMEERAAIDPRVLLDAASYDSIIPDGTHDNRTTGKGMQWSDALLIDGDGQLFVNYLLANDRLKVPAEVDSRLTNHRDLINDRLTEFRSQPAIFDKYVWMADYHNYVQREFFPDHSIFVSDIPRSNHLERVFRRVTKFPLDHTPTKLMESG